MFGAQPWVKRNPGATGGPTARIADVRRPATLHDMVDSRLRRSRLFRHDRQIATTLLRDNLADWRDRIIAVAVVGGALAGLRAWFAAQTMTVAAATALAAGMIAGFGARRLIEQRLAFHGFDGVLAADALHPASRRHYRLYWLGIGMAVLTAASLVAAPALLPASLAGYLAGAVFAGLIDRLRLPRLMPGGSRAEWRLAAWLRLPRAGIVAAAILLLAVLAARRFEASALMAVTGMVTVPLALALTLVDDGTVRFMTLAGLRTRRLLAHHARGMATFLALATPGCWLTGGAAAAGVAVAVSIAILLFMVLRILAYRLHGKRAADFLASMLAGVLVLATYMVPFALPLIALAIVWHVNRRGDARLWLLA